MKDLPSLDAARRLLVFGGPYSNRHALSALRETAETLGIEPSAIICTGDVVAYCGEPEETIALIRDWGCHVIAGNCEQQLAAGADDCGCGFADGTACDLAARDWYSYARRRVSPHARNWMSALPETIVFSYRGLTVRVVHGGVSRLNRFVFASDKAAIAEELEASGTDVTIAGHSGLPFIEPVGDRVWFNPGVIGLPANDGTPDVWYGTITPTESALTYATHRLSYDHVSAATVTARGGHADGYARALNSGLWPSLDILPPPEKASMGRMLAPSSYTAGPTRKSR